MSGDYQKLPKAIEDRLADHATQEPDLRRQISICNLLLEDAVTSKNSGLAVHLLGCHSKLFREWELSQVRKKDLIHRDEMLKIVQQLVASICNHFQDVDNFGGRIDLVNSEVLQILDFPAE